MSRIFIYDPRAHTSVFYARQRPLDSSFPATPVDAVCLPCRRSDFPSPRKSPHAPLSAPRSDRSSAGYARVSAFMDREDASGRKPRDPRHSRGETRRWMRLFTADGNAPRFRRGCNVSREGRIEIRCRSFLWIDPDSSSVTCSRTFQPDDVFPASKRRRDGFHARCFAISKLPRGIPQP